MIYFIPDNEFTNDLEYMKSMDDAYRNCLLRKKNMEQSKIDRFKSRVNESELMSNNNRSILDGMQLLFRNERNNGRQDVYEIIEEVFSPKGSFKGRIFFDDADDLIREIKLRLAEKDKH